MSLEKIQHNRFEGELMMTEIKAVIVYVVLCLILLGAPYAHARLEVRDDTGAMVSLPKPAQRIISLAPHVTEMLFSIGAGDRIIGVVNFSDYPEEAKKIQRVGSYNRFDLETIISLQPDLIVAWKSGNPETQIKKLREMGMLVYLTEPRNFEDIAVNIERLGQLTGNYDSAVKVTKSFRKQYQDLRKQYENKSKVTVFYQVWSQPLVTINGEHLIGAVIELCGGENVFKELSVLAPHISVEAVLQKNPEVIIAGARDGVRPDWLDDWKKWSGLQAVKKGNLFHVHADLLHRHSPRILQGMEKVCSYLDQVRDASAPSS